MRKNFQISAFFIYNSCLAIFLTYGLFFNKIATDLGQPPTSIAFVFGAFAIVYGLSSLFMGFLLDRFGPSRTILLGGGLMGAGLLLSSIANSIPSLVLAYGVVGGAGTGSMWPTTSCSVFETFNRDEMRHITGIVSAGTAFGSLFFAPLEAVLIAYFDWRRAFLVLAVIVLTFAVLAALAASGSRRIEIHRLRTVLTKARSKRFASLFSLLCTWKCVCKNYSYGVHCSNVGITRRQHLPWISCACNDRCGQYCRKVHGWIEAFQ